MLALLVSVLLFPSPSAATDDLDSCLAQVPVESALPVSWGNGVQQMWSDDPPAPPDTVRASLSQVRSARTCFRHLDPSTVSRPYLDNILKTYFAETALLAGLRRFSEAHSTFEEARSFLQTASSIPSTDAAHTYWPRTLHQNQGFLYYLLGNLSASIEHYLKAYQTTLDTEPSRRIQYLIDVGILHQRTQAYRSARYYYDRAEHLFQKSDPTVSTHSVQWARLLSVEADLLLEKTLNAEFGRAPLKRARDNARRARRLSEPGTERYVLSSSHLAESLGYLGAFEEAYRLNEEVRRYARTNNDSRLHTYSLLKLGVLHVQTERWAQADSVLHEALTRAERLRDLDYQRRILRSLGRLHEMQEHWRQAEQYYRDGVDVVEEYRESLTASQWSMTAFAQWRDVHRGLVRALLGQDRPREALAALNRSRARHLQDLRTQARVANQLPPEKRVRLDSLSRTLTEVRNRLGDPTSTDETTALRNREARLMAARQQLLGLESTSSPSSVNTISEVLSQRDRALVSYFLDDPWPVYDRAPRSAAFVLTGDTLRTVPLPGLTQDSVQAHVEKVSPLFTSRGKPNRANAMHFDLRPLHRLHDAVYAPVADHLPAGRSLTVIPDGPLFHTPFAMLVDSMPGGRYAPAEARYVLHDRPTSLELASSLVADTAQQTFDWSQFDPQLAAYGVSDFDTLRTVPSALRTAIPEALSDSTLSLPPLPGVRREIRTLQSTVSDTRVALNETATEPAFCRSVQQAGVLHVASHAFVNAASPLRNAILLQPDSSSEATSDGILFLHELQGQQSRIPMVVLSGCSTASGTLRGGEGMEGLQYAFRAMGAQSTLSTLWPVADQASVKLMDAFYQNLQDGHPKDVALRQAQLHFLREHPEQASPFFWAPPVLYGSPRSLPLDGPLLSAWAWWTLGLVGLLGGGLFLWWMRAHRRSVFGSR